MVIADIYTQQGIPEDKRKMVLANTEVYFSCYRFTNSGDGAFKIYYSFICVPENKGFIRNYVPQKQY